MIASHSYTMECTGQLDQRSERFSTVVNNHNHNHNITTNKINYKGSKINDRIGKPLSYFCHTFFSDFSPIFALSFKILWVRYDRFTSTGLYNYANEILRKWGKNHSLVGLRQRQIQPLMMGYKWTLRQ